MKINKNITYLYSFMMILFTVATATLKFLEISHQLSNDFTKSLVIGIPVLFLVTFFTVYCFFKPILQTSAVRISTVIYLASLCLLGSFSSIHVTSLDRILAIVMGLIAVASIYKKLGKA